MGRRKRKRTLKRSIRWRVTPEGKESDGEKSEGEVRGASRNPCGRVRRRGRRGPLRSQGRRTPRPSLTTGRADRVAEIEVHGEKTKPAKTACRTAHDATSTAEVASDGCRPGGEGGRAGRARSCQARTLSSRPPRGLIVESDASGDESPSRGSESSRGSGPYVKVVLDEGMGRS